MLIKMELQEILDNHTPQDEGNTIDLMIVVLQKGKLSGVGVALMNGKEMKELNHGEAVKIRHRTQMFFMDCLSPQYGQEYISTF